MLSPINNLYFHLKKLEEQTKPKESRRQEINISHKFMKLKLIINREKSMEPKLVLWKHQENW